MRAPERRTLFQAAAVALAVFLGVGCEGPHIEITEEGLSPLTEIEIEDPIGNALDHLEELYQARDAGTDAGIFTASSAGDWEKTDGISLFIQRITWAVFEEDELTFYEAINRVVELIASHTGRPTEGVRTDVEGALSEYIENMTPEPEQDMPPTPDGGGGSGG